MGFPFPGGGGSGSGLFPAITGKLIYVPSTGVAATDTAALQAAHDSCGVNGGTIALDPGPYALTGGSLNLTKPIHLLGTGPSGPVFSDYVSPGNAFFGTKITCASATLSAITVNSDLCTFERLSFLNTSVGVPSNGAGIKIASHGAYTRIVDCSFDSFYRNIDFQYGYYSIVERCFFQNPNDSQIHFIDLGAADWGDNIVSNCWFNSGNGAGGAHNSTAPNGIYWESGGGLKVLGCKFNANTGTRHTACVLIYLAVGSSTVDFIVNNSSLENCTYGVYFGNQGAGTISGLEVVGNQIATLAAAGACSVAAIGSAAAHVSKVVLGPNVHNGAANDYRLINVDQVVVVRDNASGIDTSGGGVTNLYMEGWPFATAARPAVGVVVAGASYYDTTLSKPGWSNGTNWKDAAGTNI